MPDPAQTIAGVQYVFTATTGLLAWDGAPLDGPYARAFIASADVARPTMPGRPSLRADVAPLLARRCALSECHRGAQAVMALDLSSPEAIVNTTVRVASRERASEGANPGARSDPRWGGLFRVDGGEATGVGAPAYSYLVYKLLGDGPVLGERMPPATAGPPLSPDEIATVSDWIARGAPDD